MLTIPAIRGSAGANPQDIDFVDAYQALQTGVVDGQDNPPSNIWGFKIHEVSKYMSITNFATGPDPLMVSLAWYESLTPDLQALGLRGMTALCRLR